jgi:hypothetical protein
VRRTDRPNGDIIHFPFRESKLKRLSVLQRKHSRSPLQRWDG